MLHTQVEYWKYKEGQRHNRAMERQTDFINQETQRHNIVTEGQNEWYNLELKRHNLASEDIGRTQARASMISAHAATTSAKAATTQASAALRQSAVAQMNAQTNYRQMLSNVSEASTRKEANLAAAEASKAQASYTSKREDYIWTEAAQGWINSVGSLVPGKFSLGGK